MVLLKTGIMQAWLGADVNAAAARTFLLLFVCILDGWMDQYTGFPYGTRVYDHR